MLPSEESIEPFDYLDEFYVLNNFTIQGLRREISSTEMHLFLYENTRDYPPFPYRAWLHLLNKCLTQLKAKVPQQTTYQNASKINIEDIKAKNDIVDVASRYTELKPAGHNRLKGKCPIHQEKTPSFTVFADKQTWHCFGCNKGGDIIALMMAAENLDFRGALVKLK